MSVARPFGEGALSRVSATVYTLVVVELLFLLTVLPGLVVLVLLGRTASNLPLVAACALPAGPALSAAVFALRQRRGDLADLHPGKAFWRGYRLNALPVLRVWVPWLAVLTVIAVSLAHLEAADIPGWWRVLLVLVATAATVWMLNAVVIISLFAFRTIDVARLAVYFLFRTPRTSLGVLCLVVVTVGLTALATELAVVLLGSVLALLLLLAARPMIDRIHADFIA